MGVSATDKFFDRMAVCRPNSFATDPSQPRMERTARVLNVWECQTTLKNRTRLQARLEAFLNAERLWVSIREPGA
jgi:hypothetical protein